VHKEFKSSSLETALENAWLSPHPFDGITPFTAEMRPIETTQIAPLHPFELWPDALVRVPLRGIGRQALQVPPRRRAVGQERLEQMAAVHGRAVPDTEQAVGDLAP
jgi:hypothetical protein